MFLLKVHCIRLRKMQWYTTVRRYKANPKQHKSRSIIRRPDISNCNNRKACQRSWENITKSERIWKGSHPPAAPRGAPERPGRAPLDSSIRLGVLNTLRQRVGPQSPGVWHQIITWAGAGEWTGGRDSCQEKVAGVGKTI